MDAGYLVRGSFTVVFYFCGKRDNKPPYPRHPRIRHGVVVVFFLEKAGVKNISVYHSCISIKLCLKEMEFYTVTQTSGGSLCYYSNIRYSNLRDCVVVPEDGKVGS